MEIDVIVIFGSFTWGWFAVISVGNMLSRCSKFGIEIESCMYGLGGSLLSHEPMSMVGHHTCSQARAFILTVPRCPRVALWTGISEGLVYPHSPHQTPLFYDNSWRLSEYGFSLSALWWANQIAHTWMH